jgi:hypothetical protein
LLSKFLGLDIFLTASVRQHPKHTNLRQFAKRRILLVILIVVFGDGTRRPSDLNGREATLPAASESVYSFPAKPA